MNSKISLTYHHVSPYPSYSDLLEEIITMEVPSTDLNINQYFVWFRSFLRAIGFNEKNIVHGASHLIFEDDEVLDQFLIQNGLIRSEEHEKEIKDLKQQNINLKAQNSRLINPEFQQYTDEEMDAMSFDR